MGESSSPRRSLSHGLWWLSPAGAMLFVTIPTLLLAWYIPDAQYREAWNSAKALTTGTVLLLLFGCLIFIAASLIPQLGRTRAASGPWPGLSPARRSLLLTASSWLFWMTIVGYIVWIGAAFRKGLSPATLIDAAVHQNTYSGTIKDAFATIPGVTTFTQFGIAFVVVATLLMVDRRVSRLPWQLAVVMMLALFRAFFLTERLAILELIVPIIAVVAMSRASVAVGWVRGLLQAAPLLLLPLVLIVFGAFEYSRSWVYFSARTGGSFVDFAIERLAGYYVTAYNNGQLMMTFEHLPGRLPLRTLDFLWTAPGVSQLNVYDRLSAPGSSTLFTDVLNQHGNPEFNNSCGLCDPFVDWGNTWALVILAAAGFLLGLAYRDFVNRRPIAMLIYPVFVTGLFELPRYLYWSQGRVIPPLVALVVVGWLVGRAEREKHQPESVDTSESRAPAEVIP